MRWLLFLSRLAFICGIFFLLTVSLQISSWSQDEAVTSTIVIIGYFLGVFIIPGVNFCYLLVLIIRKKLYPVPLWLSIANLLFLFLLIFYIFYLNFHPNE
ncbi:MAG: hypothetical protein JWM28_4568 [Chitinophagaceae bacterium]|nr:hypothetical protein [Chitinophagaceae bacterium]